MKIKVNEYSSIMLLISSVVLFILGAIVYSNPDQVVVVITYVIGGLITLLGVISCVKNYIELKKDTKTSSKGMILGILMVVIGLVFIFLSGVIETLIRFIIGGWILICGITRLANALYLEKKDTNFVVLLILAILLIIGGLYTILRTNLAFKVYGLILMIYSIIEIFGYVFNKRSVVVTSVTNKDNTDNKDVQDASIVKETKLIETKEESKPKKNNKKNKKK